MENISFLSCAFICIMVFVAGFIDAIAGGGGLITLPAYLIAGLPPHNAIATNKLSSSMGTATATYRYAREGFIPWKLALVCAAFAIAGSNIGANLSLHIGDSALKIIMLFLLPITAVFILRSHTFDTEREGLPPKKTLAVSSAIAFGVGMYDGFYGPGAGTFLIVLLTALARMKLTQANGVTKAINFSSNITALVVFLINGKVILPLGLAAGVFSIAGNWLGTKTFAGKGVKIAKPVMLLVLGIFLVKVIVEILQQL